MSDSGWRSQTSSHSARSRTDREEGLASSDVTDAVRGFGDPNVIRVTDPSQLADLSREWLDLAARVPGTSYFQTPDWVLSWWETVGRKPFTELVTWRNSSGSLEGLMFLSRMRQRLHPRLGPAWPLWTATGSGGGMADHVGWPIVAERRDEAGRYLIRHTRGATLFLQDLDPDTGVPLVPPGARRVIRNPCPRAALAPDESLSPDLRRARTHLRRYEKKADGAGISFRWVRNAEMDDRFLDRLFELHTLRMGEKGISSTFPSTRDLQRRLIARGTAGRGPIAFAAEKDRRIVGVLYFLRWGDTIAFYQSGWQPELAKLSLGRLLFNGAIREATADGLRTLDLLRGNEEYKYRLGGVDRWDESWIIPGGGTGQLLKMFLPVYRFATRKVWTRPTPDGG